ncbi:protein-L-isoaspartate O-methyltransferase family protein [Falsirhodobacter sp. 20TX0035]|uniref:protein-L-isoaspartate O-methyltransferase family protein n=1 Tax=Falsirhodobacter sp. 20TX0035 TaxID=3022019 RepID=UPI00232E48DD|nr:protein-L-isoaspartate O-methyltransferase [Falsirhodobacter sp. 20TX0035]MDB6453546.1 protein-L-isoaspartate O-methyltransferase [Falsirhodobacter sp. 20TX0035]
MPDFAARRTVMVDSQIRPSDVTKYSIIDAMLNVPRERFVPDGLQEVAYLGENIPLSRGRVLLDPRCFAKLLDALDIQPNEVALDVGAGLGYSTAVIARLAEAVIAVEDDLAPEAERRLSELGVDNAVVVSGAPAEGARRHGPYDVILVEGGVEQVPTTLTDQLKDGGRIGALFMEGNLGVARIGYRAEGVISWRPIFNASAPVMPGFTTVRQFAL